MEDILRVKGQGDTTKRKWQQMHYKLHVDSELGGGPVRSYFLFLLTHIPCLIMYEYVQTISYLSCMFLISIVFLSYVHIYFKHFAHKDFM